MTPLRRWLIGGVASVVVIAGAAAGAFAYLMYPASETYPEAHYLPAATAAEQNRQDLDYLKPFADIDRSFSTEERAQFASSLAALGARSDGLSKAQLTMEVARLVALADNGHTNVRSLISANDFPALPVRLGWFADGLFIVAAQTSERDLLGAQVLAIGGRDPSGLLEALRPFIGGSDNLVREVAPRIMVTPELLRVALAGEEQRASTLSVRLKDGSTVERVLAASAGAQSAKEGTFWPRRDLSSVKRANASPDWLHVFDGAAPPAYLSRPETNYWHEVIANKGVLYLQLNRMRSAENGPSLADYLDGVLKEIGEKKLNYAVVDLRLNRGGDYLMVADFSRRLPEVLPPDGKVFILTSGNTFSAAISTLSRLRYFGRARAMQLGEEVGDRGQMWAEGDVATLPNSKIAITFATKFHDWEKGCAVSQIMDCFLPNYVFGAAPGSLAPQVAIMPAFADYAAGRDPVMEEVLERAED
jgi:hypothetical protein